MAIDRDAYYIVHPEWHRRTARLAPDPAGEAGGGNVVYDWRTSAGALGDRDWVCDGCNGAVDSQLPVPGFGSTAQCRACAVEFFGYPEAWWDGRHTELCDCEGCQIAWVSLALERDRDEVLALFRDGAGLGPNEYAAVLEASAAPVAAPVGGDPGRL